MVIQIYDDSSGGRKVGYSVVQDSGNSGDSGSEVEVRAEILRRVVFLAGADGTKFEGRRSNGGPVVELALNCSDSGVYELTAGLGEIAPETGLDVYAEITEAGIVIDYAELPYHYPSHEWYSDQSRQIIPNGGEESQRAARGEVTSLLRSLLEAVKKSERESKRGRE